MSGASLSNTLDGDERGQLVVLAGVVIALGLVVLLTAYLQLGYHADVTTSGVGEHPTRNGERFLDSAIGEASRTVRGEYDWSEREQLVDALRTQLQPRLDTLEAARVDEGVVYTVSYDAAAASDWATDNCPSGPVREFGPCVADRGVVVQQRGSRATVLAVAVELTVTTEDGSSTSTHAIPTSKREE